jgi:hypothetical protein
MEFAMLTNVIAAKMGLPPSIRHKKRYFAEKWTSPQRVLEQIKWQK